MDALMCTVYSNRSAVVSHLIERGADVDAVGRLGPTAQEISLELV